MKKTWESLWYIFYLYLVLQGLRLSKKCFKVLWENIVLVGIFQDQYFILHANHYFWIDVHSNFEFHSELGWRMHTSGRSTEKSDSPVRTVHRLSSPFIPVQEVIDGIIKWRINNRGRDYIPLCRFRIATGSCLIWISRHHVFFLLTYLSIICLPDNFWFFYFLNIYSMLFHKYII